MRVPTGFGQFVPGDSPVHRLEARAKMGLAVAFAVAVFSVRGFAGLAAAAAAVVLAVATSHVPWRVALRGVKAVTLLLAITIAAQALRVGPAAEGIWTLGLLGVDPAGLARGVFFATRIVLLVVGTSLITLTTSPVDLSQGLERLMRPLGALGVPTADLAMMLTVALRFIPTTAQEAERIVTAQTVRGAEFGRGGPVRRARAFIPVLVPLFISLFRRSEELANAMEARGYRGGAHRTRLKESVMGAKDWATLVLGVALLAAMAVAL